MRISDWSSDVCSSDLPIEGVFENLARILSVTDLPVTIDMESGHGADAATVGVSVGRARAAGAARLNLEDRLPGRNDRLPGGEAVAGTVTAAGTGPFVTREPTNSGSRKHWSNIEKL